MFQRLLNPTSAIIFGGLAITGIPKTMICNSQWSVSWIHQMVMGVGLCPSQSPPVAMIPALIDSPELRILVTPVSRRIPDTTAMSNNRLELGKITGALTSVDTPESKQAIKALERYDKQARKTILEIAKLNSASELTADTCIHILEGLIETLTQAPLENSDSVKQILSFKQARVDSWVQGLQTQLKRLFEQANQVRSDLASCDNHILQMYDTAGIAYEERQEYDKLMVRDAPNWITRVFFGVDSSPILRDTVKRAIENFGALMVATREAHSVVNSLSLQLEYVITSIEAAYRYHDQMVVLDLTVKEQVNLATESLKRLKKDIENEKILR